MKIVFWLSIIFNIKLIIFYKGTWYHLSRKLTFKRCALGTKAIFTESDRNKWFLCSWSQKWLIKYQLLSVLMILPRVAWRKQPSRISQLCRNHPYRRWRKPHRKLHLRIHHRIQGYRGSPARTSWSLMYRGHHSCRHHRCPKSGR